MADYKDITVGREGGILILTLNRPHRRNALNQRISQEAAQVMEQVGTDDEVKVVVLTGAGTAFCSGGDLTPPGPGDEPMPKEPRWLKTTPLIGWGRLSLNLRNCPKPVIAAVNGPAFGAGFSIALACDIRIAAESARFSSAFVRRGLMPDSGLTYFLPRLVGTAKALELMFTGDIIDAREAEKLGIVNRIVPDSQLMEATMEMANKIAKGASLPIELTKQVVYHGQMADLQTGLGYETWGVSVCQNSHDVKEGIKAFNERRDPVFRGE